MNLKNRLVVIAGATGDMGFNLAHRLGEMGASLALLGKDAEKISSLTESLSLPASRLLTHVVDLTNNSETRQAAGMVAARFKRMDILINIIGGWTGGKSLVEAAPEDLAFMLNQHVWASFNIIQSFVPHLVSNGWGRVVMISSPYAERPVAKGGPYAAGKAGQDALMKALAQEIKGTGVTANMLLVKTIDTKGSKTSAPTAENSSWTTPEEIISAILFLVSEEAGMINGAHIPVFGTYP